MKEIVKIILVILLFIVSFLLLIIFSSELPMLSEKLSYGESSRSFCQSQDGVFQNNLLGSDYCYIGEERYNIYLKEGKWKLAK